jgi:lysozyme family protein
MSKVDDIITDIIKREGGDIVTNTPGDVGGRTQYGISETSNPQAWVDNKVTEAEAREIYLKKYVNGPGFDKIVDPQLQAQLVDFGVTSGPQLAIMKLQECIGADGDGVLGPQTLQLIEGIYVPDINNRLVSARVKMIGKIVTKNPSQLKFLNGWVNRALEFLR